MWLFLAFGIVVLMARRVFDRSTLVLCFFLLTFGVVLSYSAFPFPRYALPITVLGYFVSGQLIASALRGSKQPRWFKQAMVALCLGLIIALQGTRCWRFDMQFADDSRQRLHEWAARGLAAWSSGQFWWNTTPASMDRATLGGIRTRPPFTREC